MKIINFINIAVMIMVFCNAKTNPVIKKSILAGTWYPADPARLSADIDGYLQKAITKKDIPVPLVLILPHAGYVYSGTVAAAGYNILKQASPDVIIILSPSHHSYFRGCSLMRADFYETPLGRLRVDKAAVEALLKEPLFQNNPADQDREHSIEIQLPFLQRIFGKRMENDITILPILAGEISDQDAASISYSIIKSIKDKKSPVFIVSSDFTHYGPRFGYVPFPAGGKNIIQKKLKDLDMGAADKILKRDFKGFSDYVEKTDVTICGRNPIKIALSLPIENFRSEPVMYDTSGNITGDWSNTVSYVSISISGTIGSAVEEKKSGFNLDESEKKFLLKLARDNIESLLYKNTGVAVDQKNVPENCRYATGVFVTLKKEGELRGCIGYVLGMKALYEEVIENSYNAAFKDPRFQPLDKDEYKDISIEISVLTVPEPVNSVDEIKVGRDGLIIEKGFSRGLLLPQVPVEWGWSRDEFLVHTCRKAGLPDDAWKEGAKLSRFEAIVFGEENRR